jgi:hypothetical protein
MAKLDLNTALKGIHGRIDNWVYRQFGNRTIIGPKPVFAGAPTAAQLANRERFQEAAAYGRAALADPMIRPLYVAAAKARDLPPFAVIIEDYFTSPEVKVIDVTGYHGHIGELIKVNATDDFEVVGVDVVIRNGAALVEHGPAVLADGLWTYAATVAVVAGETVMIEAVAKDRPGHTGTKTVPCTIA